MSLTLKIEPSNAAYAEDDARWQQQVAELRQELGAARASSDAEGSKGDVLSLAMFLIVAAPNLLPAIAQLITAWCGRDRDRSVKLTWSEGDEEQSLTIDGVSVSNETLKAALEAAFARDN